MHGRIGLEYVIAPAESSNEPPDTEPGKKISMNRFNLLVLLSLVFQGAMAPSAIAKDETLNAPRLTAENLAAWKSHILPTAAELKWTQIPWLPDLQSGIEASARMENRDKPLLLWTMNGHPLGCT